MIVDFQSGDAPSDYRANVCIIGSGPIGLALAAEFLDDPSTDVVVVESGGLGSSAAHDSLNRVINTGDTPSGLPGSRARVFGGTSTIWGGQSIPLSATDFEPRPWVPNSGWPIPFAHLTDYFQRAASILNLDGSDFDRDIWKKGSGFKQSIDAQELRLTFSRWSPSPDFAKSHRKIVGKSSNVTALVNASVSELEVNEAGTAVDSVAIRALGGRAGRVRAERFILCCGGIENARLLLCSTSRRAEGVGNAHGNVGRYFQDHVAFYGARLIPTDFRKFVNLFSSYFNGDQMYLPKLQLSEAAQEKTRSLNVIGNVAVEYKDSAVALKRLFNDLKTRSVDADTLDHIVEIIKDPVDSIRLLVCYAIRRRMYYPKRADYFLVANCETEPAAESRITLGKERDALGLPIAQVNWTITHSVKHGLLVYLERVKHELGRLEIAEAVIKPSLYQDSDEWKRSIFSIYHHIGTTRMSDRPEHGVVDRNCKVHGVDNLYVAGSSVFPTSGAANPTFTALALAFRLADHLRASV